MIVIVLGGFGGFGVLAESQQSANQAGQPSKPITNADIVAMATARLSDDVIVNAIRRLATPSFDLSPSALIELKKTGVSDRVIAAMQESAPAAQTTTQTASDLSDGSSAGLALTSSEPCRIFITEEEPTSGAYVVVRKEVQVGKKYYGRHDDNLMQELAKTADREGADAIIKFHEWRAPSKWSWAAAKAGGMAVKWTTEGKRMISALKGQCWDPKGQ